MSINEAGLREGSDGETLEFEEQTKATRNGNIESHIQTAKWANRHPQNQLALFNSSSLIFGQQENRMQNMLSPAFASPNFHQGVSSHQVQLLNNHVPMRMGAPTSSSLSFQLEGMSSGNHNNQMTMNWLDNIPPRTNTHQVNWIPHGQNSLIPTPPQDLRCPRNSLYDPMYAAMGLPVDPHLRMFLAGCDAGNHEDK